MRQNRVHAPAPSICAASKSSSGTDCRPADIMMKERPRNCQMVMTATAGRAQVVFSSVGGEGLIPRALSAPIFRRIATLGYGVYLVHMPIIHYGFMPVVEALHRRGGSMVIVWSGALLSVIVASLTLAYALHVFVETVCSDNPADAADGLYRIRRYPKE